MNKNHKRIYSQLVELSKEPGFKDVLEQFNAANILYSISSDSDSETTSIRTKITRKTVATRKNIKPIKEEKEYIYVSDSDSDYDSDVEVIEIKPQKKRKTFGIEMLPYTGKFMNNVYELKKIKFIHVVTDTINFDDISNKVLTLNTFEQNAAYAEWTVFVLGKNLILPIGNAKIYPSPGFTALPLDNHVHKLLTKSVESGVWKMVDNLPDQFAPDGKKYFTFTIDESDIVKYELRKPRV